MSEPEIVLTGCTPFSRVDPKPCPACRGRVDDRPDKLGREKPSVVFCARCDGMSENSETRLAHQRAEAEVASRGKAAEQGVDRKVDKAAIRHRRTILSEAQRREIWYGYRGSPLASLEPTNLAKVGREFLAAIGQLPNWNLKLDARGKVVGYWNPPE